MAVLIVASASSMVSSGYTKSNSMFDAENRDCVDAYSYCAFDCDTDESSCKFACEIMHNPSGQEGGDPAGEAGCRQGCEIISDGCHSGCEFGTFECVWYWWMI